MNGYYEVGERLIDVYISILEYQTLDRKDEYKVRLNVKQCVGLILKYSGKLPDLLVKELNFLFQSAEELPISELIIRFDTAVHEIHGMFRPGEYELEVIDPNLHGLLDVLAGSKSVADWLVRNYMGKPISDPLELYHLKSLWQKYGRNPTQAWIPIQ